MAITITLPNIGGIIGPTETVDGPLSTLYQSQYNIATLHYPRDLGSKNRGHSVLFTVKKIKEVTLNEAVNRFTGNYNALTLPAEDPISGNPTNAYQDSIFSSFNLGDAINNLFSGSISISSDDIIKGAGSIGRVFGDTVNNALRQNTEIVSHVELYMPENLNFSYDAQYNSLSLIEAAASLPLVGRVASGINSIMQNSAAKLILNKAGYVFNPQQQLLFEGIDFRTYQMSFTFSPVSREEANMVRKIIKTFRQYAAPTIVREAAGMFFVPPAIFDIQFRLNGQENRNVNKVEESVITNIEVNYTPNGWASHEDGAPVQTTITLSFKEIALIDRAKVEEGF
jgi:hypothetical protein